MAVAYFWLLQGAPVPFVEQTRRYAHLPWLSTCTLLARCLSNQKHGEHTHKSQEAAVTRLVRDVYMTSLSDMTAKERSLLG